MQMHHALDLRSASTTTSEVIFRSSRIASAFAASSSAPNRPRLRIHRLARRLAQRRAALALQQPPQIAVADHAAQPPSSCTVVMPSFFDDIS